MPLPTAPKRTGERLEGLQPCAEFYYFFSLDGIKRTSKVFQITSFFFFSCNLHDVYVYCEEAKLDKV